MIMSTSIKLFFRLINAFALWDFQFPYIYIYVFNFPISHILNRWHAKRISPLSWRL